MRIVSLSLLLALGAASPQLAAADPSASAIATQDPLFACSEQAKAVRADQRKAFIRACLPSGEIERIVQRREKLIACANSAGDARGDERRKRIGDCLRQ